ncbi:MAG: lactonase family protein [Bacilli bacterium]|nr:lactonase family protein [Bacilli bacterium]
MKLYLGTYTKKASEGVYQLELNQDRFENLELLHKVDNPTYIDLNANTLFSVVKDGSKGGIAYFKDGLFVNQVVEEGAPPCFVSSIPSKGLVFSANYHGGRVNVYALKDGGLVDHQSISFGEGSKAHYIQYNEVLDRVLVCDLGLDRVYAFRIVEDNKLSLSATYQADAKTGPRHLVVHPETKLVYIFTELSSEVHVVDFTNDEVKFIESVSALPEGLDAQKWGAAIRLSKDGKYLYVSNRGHDSISVFKVGETLQLIQNVSTEGVQPRDFNLSPCGKYCVVANHDTNNLTLFAIDQATGLLTLLQKDFAAPEAVCVVFA